MTVEIRRYWRRNEWSNGVLDKEASTPKHEMPDEMIPVLMKLLELNGFKRHETKTAVFYDKVLNCNEVEEDIFYK